jgi:hypothetical protein
MKEKLVGAMLLLIAFNAVAQADSIRRVQKMRDSIAMGYLRMAAIGYPILRQASISTEVIGSSPLNSKLYDKDFYKGDAQITRVRANINLPIWQTRRNIISTSFAAVQQFVQLDKGTSYNAALPVPDQRVDRSTYTFIASYTHSDSLFNKPVSFSVSAAALTNQDFSTLRMNYFGTVAFTLKRTATTNLAVGVAVLLDPASPVPASPFMSYWHRFTKSKLDLFVDLPYRVSLRKTLSSRAFLSVGSQLSTNLFFFSPDNTLMPGESVFTTLEIRSGATFEYLVGKHIVLGVNGGLLSTVQSRMFEKSSKSNDYYLGNKMNSAPFVNFSVSVLPFLKGFH